jgi:SAM-dependent methyltransferase
MRPYSSACERNQGPIWEVLAGYLRGDETVLEIGSGTGQHAVHFAALAPRLTWIATDVAERLPGIRTWIEATGVTNVRGPLTLDVNEQPWPVVHADAVYSANTAHIMSWDEVLKMIDGAARVVGAEGLLMLYGPFRRGGRHVSGSNERFDQSLRAERASQGVRDLEAVDDAVRACGFAAAEIHEMPANNLCVAWRRRGTP